MRKLTLAVMHCFVDKLKKVDYELSTVKRKGMQAAIFPHTLSMREQSCLVIGARILA